MPPEVIVDMICYGFMGEREIARLMRSCKTWWDMIEARVMSVYATTCVNKLLEKMRPEISGCWRLCAMVCEMGVSVMHLGGLVGWWCRRFTCTRGPPICHPVSCSQVDGSWVAV
jgi:hypothetical protein